MRARPWTGAANTDPVHADDSRALLRRHARVSHHAVLVEIIRQATGEDRFVFLDCTRQAMNP